MKSFLDKNLSTLSFLDRDLAERMRQVPLQQSVRVVDATSGLPTASVVAPDGAAITLHSEYDPLKEARSFVMSQKIHQVDGCALAGMGIGYPAVELVNRLDPHPWLGLIEAREDIFRAALEYTDLTPVFSRKNTMLFVGHDFLSFQHWLKRFLDMSEAEEVTLLSHLPSLRLLPQFYDHVVNEIGMAVNRKKIELATLLRYGKELEENAITNLRHTARAAGVIDFRDQFKGCPAIVVAAGPSLNHAMELLKKASGKAVLVCVGKVLQLLLRSGIVPEFTTHLDMLPIGKTYFEGVSGLDNVVLVFDPDCNHEAVSAYSGPKATCDTLVQITQWSRGALGEKGYLEKGISVAHTAFFLARELGADPIILVGVDLALPKDQTHANGVVPTWGGTVNEAELDITTVPSVKGGPIRSLRSFLSFITAFEAELSRTRSRVINTSEEGALIRGAEFMPLSEALDRYCTKDILPCDRVRACLSKGRSFDRDRFAAMSQEVLNGIQKIIEQCEPALKYLRRLKTMDPSNKFDGTEVSKLAARINESRTILLRQELVLPLLQRVMAPYAYGMKKISKRLQAIPEDDRPARLPLEIQRTELMFQGYLDSAQFFQKQFSSSVRQILAS